MLPPDGTNALNMAIVNAYFELASVLLDHGADPNTGLIREGRPCTRSHGCESLVRMARLESATRPKGTPGSGRET